MRALDWERVLTEQRIPYITNGPNVKRGELAIQCPFCGSADPSKHMGLNLDTGWWSCWRNRAQHSGKSPLRLLIRLLGVPYERAREIAGLSEGYIDPEGFDAAVARIMGRLKNEGRPEQIRRRVLRFEDSFEEITSPSRVRTKRYWDYLAGRGFDLYEDDVKNLGREYNLRVTTGGYWGSRIIIPYYQDGDLVTWTGRAIGKSTARYLDLSIDESLLAAKETLFNHDCMLAGGKALVIQEGPMDVLKTDFYGKAFGVRAVGLSTNSIKDAQSYLLQTAIGKFSRILVMLDNASRLGIVDSMRMKQALHFLPGIEITPVPYGAKDGGELTPREVIKWAKAL